MSSQVIEEVQWASYSSLTTHRACPQRWFYGSVRKLRTLNEDPAAERDFGSWWHALRAIESMQRGRELGCLKWVPKEVRTTDDGPRLAVSDTLTVYDLLVAAEYWWDRRSEDYRANWIAKLGEPAHVRLLSAFERWQTMWEAEIVWESPLAVELSWGRDLPLVVDPFTGEKVDPLTRLVGYVDEVFLDRRRNVVVVRDHKTGKSLSSQTSADDMMDSQLQLYAWGASPTVAEWNVGRIEATAYDRACSVAPRPPGLTMSGRLATRLGEPSISSADLRCYLEWAIGPDGEGAAFPGLKKDGSGAGFYQPEQDIIDRLSTPTAQSVWFQRTLTPLSTHVVKAHLRAAVDSALDQRRSRARAEQNGEAARNLTSGCRWCDFAKLCRAELVGGPSNDYDLADFNLRQV